LGILGLGRIGEKIARYGVAFEMPVFAFDPLRPDWVEGVARCESLDQLLARSDVFCIHVPLNGATRGMIGRRELERLPVGAWVVNTARGECLDEDALVDLLASGRIGGGALDVLCDERGGDDLASRRAVAYARAHSNLLITPHIGGATVESMAATEVFIAQRIAKVLAASSRRRRDVNR
jgi:D-3-phosphoglycerate dehydrogenase